MAGTPLVLGASGRLGRMVLRAWRSKGAQGRKIAAQYRSDTENATQTDLTWDIEDGLDPVKRWIESNGPISTFVILSGVTPSTGSKMDDNISIANSYLEAASTLKVPRVLLASSSAVYGTGNGEAFSEDDVCKPLSAYGISKMTMELSAQIFRNSGVEVCCLRIGNVAGADALLLNAPKAHFDSPLTIDYFSNGHGPQRSYIGPCSLAYVLGQLIDLQNKVPFVLNIAATEPVYMEELAEAAALPWVSRAPQPNAQQRIVLNCERLASLVQLNPGSGSAHTLISEWRECI